MKTVKRVLSLILAALCGVIIILPALEQLDAVSSIPLTILSIIFLI